MAGPQGLYSEMANAIRWRSRTCYGAAFIRCWNLSRFRKPGSIHFAGSVQRTSLSRLCWNLGLNFGWGISESYQTEEYVKLLDEVEYRRQVADSIGLGFELLPEKPIVCNVRIKSAKEKIAIAA
jgi:hypothetical protein